MSLKKKFQFPSKLNRANVISTWFLIFFFFVITLYETIADLGEKSSPNFQILRLNYKKKNHDDTVGWNKIDRLKKKLFNRCNDEY